MMFILSSISSGLQFWSINRTSIFENSELKYEVLGEISNNWPNESLRKIVHKTLESFW